MSKGCCASNLLGNPQVNVSTPSSTDPEVCVSVHKVTPGCCPRGRHDPGTTRLLICVGTTEQGHTRQNTSSYHSNQNRTSF